MSTLTSHLSVKKLSLSKLLWVGPSAALAAVLANILVYYLIQIILSGPIIMPYQGPGTPAEPLPLTPVVFASAIPAIAAAILYGILGRFTQRPTLYFLIISAVFLALSFGGPASLPIALTLKLGLSVMHIVAGTVTVSVLIGLGYEK